VSRADLLGGIVVLCPHRSDEELKFGFGGSYRAAEVCVQYRDDARF